MTVLGGFPIFSYFSSQTRSSDRLRKSFGPTISCAIKRQPFSSTTQRQIPKSTQYNANSNYYKQDTSSKQSGPEVVTENSVLNDFPRPNLMPTLHFSLFGYDNKDTNGNKKTATPCKNCSGPHSTDFCPC